MVYLVDCLLVIRDIWFEAEHSFEIYIRILVVIHVEGAAVGVLIQSRSGLFKFRYNTNILPSDLVVTISGASAGRAGL